MELIKFNEEKKQKRNSTQVEINNISKDIMNLNNKIDILNDNIKSNKIGIYDDEEFKIMEKGVVL